MRWLRVVGLVVMLLASIGIVQAEPFERQEFQGVWNRTDLPVQQGRATRSWTWGPEPFTVGLNEWYTNSPGEHRLVQYFDKSRMEINNPDAPRNEWYVTNGLLVVEMIEGKVQVGDNKLIPLDQVGANIPIAGDPNNTFPTYASLIRPYRTPVGYTVGDHITTVFYPEGAGEFPQYANDSATEIVQLQQRFGIPRAFWDFMNQRGTVYESGAYRPNQQLYNWLYVFGYPVTDAFWTRVRVGGVERDVMFQAFERRILTYTPANDPAWRVEMGNVGQHYYRWRYVEPFAQGRQAFITVPAANATVQSPLTVQGFESGAAFEGSVTVRLRTASGTTLVQQPTTVNRPDIALAGPFETALTWTAPASTTAGTLEIVIFSPRDGTEQIIASQPVTIRGR